MSKELAVIEKVVKTGKGIDSLEKLISSLPEVATQDLVTGFRLANGYSKKIETFVDAVKKELVNNATQTGRFIAEGTPDEKGHLYLAGVDGDELKAEKRVYAKFNADKATELLKEKELFELGSEERVTCKDPETVHRLLVSLVDQVDLPILVTIEAMLDQFEVTRVATEARVEALVALEKIETSDVAKVMDVGIQYAVKEVKAKKK